VEEKRLQALEAAKKKSTKGKKKGKGEEDPVEEPEPQTRHEAAPKEEDFDLFAPGSFDKALQARVRRPFVFGPVEFEGLDQSEADAPFAPEAQRDRVT